jgi:ribonuclease P protein component
MLPAHHRLRAARDFTTTTRYGTRRFRGCVVVSGYRPSGANGPARVGLAVGKSVGNSVQRHAVSRRIRGVMASLVGELPDGSLWVVRGLPGAAGSRTLAEDLRSAVVAVRDAL